MKIWLLFACITLSFILSGCNDRCEITLEENKKLSGANTELAREIVDLRQEKQQLQRQLMTIKGIGNDIRLENIINVKKIEVANRTGFYDKDYDGTDEKLIIYLKTVDEFGDAIKAAGAVEIQLWNLQAATEQAKLAQWNISPAQLKSEWAATMLTNYYRLTFDVSALNIPQNQNLTVKVKFTDYLTGKIFEQQTVVKSKSKPSSARIRSRSTALGSVLSSSM